MQQLGDSFENKPRRLTDREQKTLTARVTAAVLAELSDDSESRRSSITLGEIAEQYMAERQHMKASSLKTYHYALKTHLLPHFGSVPWADIDVHAIALLRTKLAVTLSGRSANKIIGLLRALTNWAAVRGLSEDGTLKASAMECVRQENTEVDPFTRDEVDAVLRCLKPRYRSFFAALAWTGARLSELQALRWRDVDLQAGEININKARVRGVEGTTKTPSSKRRIPLFPPARIAFELQKPYSFSDENNYVFVNNLQLPYEKGVDGIWKRACVRAGVKHRPLRQLRHSFASWCLAAGEDPLYVSRLLGHSNPEVTFRYYARWIPDQRRDGHQLDAAIREHYGMVGGERTEATIKREETPQVFISPRAEVSAFVDPVDLFLQSHAMRGDDLRVDAHDLHDAYVSWCDETGRNTLTRNVFGRFMTARGFYAAKVGHGRYKYLGIGLRTAAVGVAMPEPKAIKQHKRPGPANQLENAILNAMKEHANDDFRLADIWNAVKAMDGPVSYGGVKKALRSLRDRGEIHVIMMRLGNYALGAKQPCQP